MSLGADAVNGHAGSKPLLNVRHHAVGQLGGRGAVEVVVVYVQDRVRVGGAGGLETDADKILPEDLGEDGRAEGAVFVEHLVDDVLGLLVAPHDRGTADTHITPDLAFIPRHDGSDMRLDSIRQLGLVFDVANPSR